MLSETDQQYTEEVKRLLDKSKEILGPLTPSQALNVFLALLGIHISHQLSEKAGVDFLHRGNKFSQTYPLPAQTEADIASPDENTTLALAVGQAWATLEPTVHNRAVQIALYSVCSMLWQMIHGDACAKKWNEMTVQWAKHWGVPVTEEEAQAAGMPLTKKEAMGEEQKEQEAYETVAHVWEVEIPACEICKTGATTCPQVVINYYVNFALVEALRIAGGFITESQAAMFTMVSWHMDGHPMTVEAAKAARAARDAEAA